MYNKTSSRYDSLLRHLQAIHTANIPDSHRSLITNSIMDIKQSCEYCKKEVVERTNVHKKNTAEPVNEDFKIVKSYFDERIQ